MGKVLKIIYTLLLVGVVCTKLNAAEVNLKEAQFYDDGMRYVPTAITIKGKINPGDSQVFFDKFIKSFSSKFPVEEVWLFESEGGDLNEAISIGKLINDVYLKVAVVGDCYSACSFIALSAKYRVFIGNLGLHRPYFDQRYYAGLSAQDAELKYKAMREDVRSYLSQQDVAGNVVDKMFATSSSDVWLLNSSEAFQVFGAMKPPFHEWVKAQCPGRDSREVDVDTNCLNKVIRSARDSALQQLAQKVQRLTEGDK